MPWELLAIQVSTREVVVQVAVVVLEGVLSFLLGFALAYQRLKE